MCNYFTLSTFTLLVLLAFSTPSAVVATPEGSSQLPISDRQPVPPTSPGQNSCSVDGHDLSAIASSTPNGRIGSIPPSGKYLNSQFNICASVGSRNGVDYIANWGINSNPDDPSRPYYSGNVGTPRITADYSKQVVTFEYLGSTAGISASSPSVTILASCSWWTQWLITPEGYDNPATTTLTITGHSPVICTVFNASTSPSPVILPSPSHVPSPSPSPSHNVSGSPMPSPAPTNNGTNVTSPSPSIVPSPAVNHTTSPSPAVNHTASPSPVMPPSPIPSPVGPNSSVSPTLAPSPLPSPIYSPLPSASPISRASPVPTSSPVVPNNGSTSPTPVPPSSPTPVSSPVVPSNGSSPSPHPTGSPVPHNTSSSPSPSINGSSPLPPTPTPTPPANRPGYPTYPANTWVITKAPDGETFWWYLVGKHQDVLFHAPPNTTLPQPSYSPSPSQHNNTNRTAQTMTHGSTVQSVDTLSLHEVAGDTMYIGTANGPPRDGPQWHYYVSEDAARAGINLVHESLKNGDAIWVYVNDTFSGLINVKQEQLLGWLDPQGGDAAAMESAITKLAVNPNIEFVVTVPEDGKPKKLGTLAIVGISVGGIVVLALIAFVATRPRARGRSHSLPEGESGHGYAPIQD